MPNHPLPQPLGRALCRLVRGAAVPEDAGDLAGLVELGLAARVSSEECSDSDRWETLAREGRRLRDHLVQARRPGGLAALVPGAAARFRTETERAQAQLDAADRERREIEERYTALQRSRWAHVALGMPLVGGGRLLPAPEGIRAACAFWSGDDALPTQGALFSALAGQAAAAAAVVQAFGEWRQMPAETLWLCGALLWKQHGTHGPAGVETVRTLHDWLEAQELWGEDPLPAAMILAGSPWPGTAARKAVEAFDMLRARNLGAETETFIAACRLAATRTWLPLEARMAALDTLLRRADDLGLMAVHRSLPLLAPLACLPRPVAETGDALRAIRAMLRARHFGAASTLDAAAIILAGTGFYSLSRDPEQDLLSDADPVAVLMANRYEALLQSLRRPDGGDGASEVEVLAGAAATIPGRPAAIVGALSAARQALLAAGGPETACGLPVALALTAGCCGAPLGLDPRDIAWELLRAGEMTKAAWRAPSSQGNSAPGYNPRL